ncbi:MAG: DUF5658 family protein [Candidatus Aminicenantales bacterium]
MKKIKSLIISLISLVIISSVPLFGSGAEAIIVNTAIGSQSINPLSSLDLLLIPEKQPASTQMNLNLNKPVINLSAHKYINQEVRIGKFSDSLYDVSMISLIALNVADYLSTTEALKYPGLQEGNPLMKPFIKNSYVFAAVKIGLTAFSYYNMKNLYKKNKPLAWALSIASNLALSYVVSNNYRNINRVKGK